MPELIPQDILDYGNWELFCEITGLTLFCINEGMDGSQPVLLTDEQFRRYLKNA